MSWIALNTTGVKRPSTSGHEEDGNVRTFNLLRVSCTSIMCVDLFRRRGLIERDETVQKIVAREIVTIPTIEVGEIVSQSRVRKLFSK